VRLDATHEQEVGRLDRRRGRRERLADAEEDPHGPGGGVGHGLGKLAAGMLGDGMDEVGPGEGADRHSRPRARPAAGRDKEAEGGGVVERRHNRDRQPRRHPPGGQVQGVQRMVVERPPPSGAVDEERGTTRTGKMDDGGGARVPSSRDSDAMRHEHDDLAGRLVEQGLGEAASHAAEPAVGIEERRSGVETEAHRGHDATRRAGGC